MNFEEEEEEEEEGEEAKEAAEETKETEESEETKETEESEGKEPEKKGSFPSFLTERQLEVLHLRHQGLSQQDIGERLGTTRSNISILEKRAHQNISRAEKTVQQWMMIRAPITLGAKAGMDAFDLPKMIFAAADERGIHLPITSLDIVVQLRRRAPKLFQRRALEKDVQIYVTEDGMVMVEEVQ